MGSLNSNVQAASGRARAANASPLSLAPLSCPEAARVRAARAIRSNDCRAVVSGTPLRPDIDRLPRAQPDRALASMRSGLVLMRDGSMVRSGRCPSRCDPITGNIKIVSHRAASPWRRCKAFAQAVLLRWSDQEKIDGCSVFIVAADRD